MKQLCSFILVTFLCITSLSPVHAHPLDISVSTGSISGKSFSMTTYFHTYEIEYLLMQQGYDLKGGVEDYFKAASDIADYVSQRTSIINNGSQCRLKNIEVSEDEVYIVLSDGLRVSSRFECDDDIEKLDISLKYFIEFPLQTNRITLYDVSAGIAGAESIVYQVLTAKKPYFEVDIYNRDDIVHLDDDKDGLSNEDEKIYATDPNNPDSDGDNFSDSEEVYFGWDPLSVEMGPGQELRAEFDPEESFTQIDKLGDVMGAVAEKNLSDFSGNNSGVLKNTLEYISKFFEKNEGNMLGMFWLVFLLGMIHTLGPGHSKGLLVSYTLEKRNGYLKGFLFAFVFTLTHIVDILLLVFIAKMLSGVFQTHYTSLIQVSSAVLLFCFGLYLVWRNVRALSSAKKSLLLNNNPPPSSGHLPPNKGEEQEVKTSLWIAFLAGLAPCSFAWSIFLLLGALGKPHWIFPLVLALGIGIFTTLCGIVLLSVFLKNRMYGRIKNLGYYSSLFSALMILIISVVMIWRVV
ncbi:hypothetical protein MK079_02100 [Candidatus Gracilibacteria bacterium]|nr:hypothetical protein [Candidatus Gracilibacteria bacterium]